LILYNKLINNKKPEQDISKLVRTLKISDDELYNMYIDILTCPQRATMVPLYNYSCYNCNKLLLKSSSISSLKSTELFVGPRLEFLRKYIVTTLLPLFNYQYPHLYIINLLQNSLELKLLKSSSNQLLIHLQISNENLLIHTSEVQYTITNNELIIYYPINDLEQFELIILQNASTLNYQFIVYNKN